VSGSIAITQREVLKRKIGDLVENLKVPKKFQFNYCHHGHLTQQKNLAKNIHYFQ